MFVCVSEDEVFSVEVGGNETQATLRDLKPNHTYQLRIAAGTRAGFSQPSEWAVHHTPNLTQGEDKLIRNDLRTMFQFIVTPEPPVSSPPGPPFLLSCS